MPLVVSAAVIAMPVRAPASTSVTLSRPPAGGLRSTSADTRVPTAPTGAPASSFTAVSAGAAAALSTGASLTAVTTMLAVSVAVEKAVVPPLVMVEALPPPVPLVWSQARNVRALAMVPLKLAAGWK